MTGFDLKITHCADASCTSATTSTIDSEGNVGRFTSITIGADWLGLVSYEDDTKSDLKVAHCANVACTSAITSTLDSDSAVAFTAVTTGTDGSGSSATTTTRPAT